MKRILTTVLVLIFFAGCKKEVKVDDVLTNFQFSQSEISADGQSTVNISVVLTDKSSTDRRNVIFSTSSGVFLNSGNSKYTAKAEFDNGLLVAKAVLRASTKPGTIKVTVKPEYDSPIMEYVLMDSVIAKPSFPATIKLEPSSFGIVGNFISEVQINGILQNLNGKYVSSGYSVVFEDMLMTGGQANGHFRNLQTTTSDSSKVSGKYSASNYSVGTQIIIKGTVLDLNGLRTSISDSIVLTINEQQ